MKRIAGARARILAVLVASLGLAFTTKECGGQEKASSSSRTEAQRQDDIVKEIVKVLTEAFREANNEEAPKENIDYRSDSEIIKGLYASMNARLNKITVKIPGADTQEMVPGIIVFSRAIKNSGGRIEYCRVNRNESLGAIIRPFVPEIFREGKELIAEAIRKTRIPNVAKYYSVYAYLRDDNRTVEFLEFRKRTYDNERC